MGEAHAGRLLDHVHVRVAELGASRRFYEGAVAPLGIEVQGGDDWFSADELFVSQRRAADEGSASRVPGRG